MARFASYPVYLFYGNRADEILKARDAVLDALIPAAERAENLTDIYAASAQSPVRLAKVIPDLAGDFATLSFIPDATKVAVITDPVELFEGDNPGRGRAKAPAKTAKSAKADSLEDAMEWIARDLPATPHHLIVLAFEDEAAGREVSEQSAVFAQFAKLGLTQRFRNTKAFFRIEDALVGRNLDALISSIRELWKNDQAVYNAVQRCMRLMIQANIARDRRAINDPVMQATLFPGDPRGNLLKSAPNIQRKYLGAPVYRTDALITAYSQLLEVYRAMRPRPDALYVPDSRGLLERTLIRLLTSEPPRR